MDTCIGLRSGEAARNKSLIVHTGACGQYLEGVLDAVASGPECGKARAHVGVKGVQG